MFKYLILALLVVACSDSRRTSKITHDVSEGLAHSKDYHDYIDNVVIPASQELIKNYEKNPTEVCDLLAEKSSSSLIDLYDVLTEVKDEVPCANDALKRIENFYEDFSAKESFAVQLSGSRAATLNLNSSALILDKAYSLPEEKPLPSKVINLTFDDGPHSANTRKILAALKHYGVKANFFIVGRNAKISPDLVKALAQGGHSVGGHSMTHSNLSKIGFSKATKEINGIFDVIESILGATDPFFRFPYGARTPSLRRFLKENNATDFFWSVDTLDWKYKDPEFLLKYALDQTFKKGRGIVLFHDIQPQTAAILPSYLDVLANAGYSTVVYEPK